MTKKKISRGRKTKAKFTKHCTECIFLVNYNGMDLYFWPENKHKGPYLIRYGDKKDNFVAGEGDSTLFPELQIAKTEALQLRDLSH